MSSQTYRYYHLDAVGHLNLGGWFEAEEDEFAIAPIGQIQTGARCEVWQCERLLAKLSPDYPSAEKESEIG